MLLRSLPTGAVTLALGVAGLAACKSAGAIPGDARTTVLSMIDLDCNQCGEDLARAMVVADGVYRTAFDKRRAEVTVVAAPSVNALALASEKRPTDETWQLAAGAGHGRYRAWQTPPASADVKQIAHDGADVADLAPHLAPGKLTVVDFSAKWCEPCRALDGHMLAIVAKRPDVAYRKLDVGDWDSPLGKHYLDGVKALPYVLVFDAGGRRIDAISGLDLARLDRALKEAP